MNQKDARVIKTRQALRQALIDLVAEEDYESLTVRTIAKQANVGFKTFYRHYTDKDDLLYSIINETFEEIIALRHMPTSLEDSEKNAELMLRFAKENEGAVYVLFNSPAFQNLIKPMVAFGMAEGQIFYEASLKGQAEGHQLPPDLVAYHFVSSIVGLMRWWVENGMTVPIDEMAENINALVIRPIWNLHQDQAKYHKK